MPIQEANFKTGKIKVIKYTVYIASKFHSRYRLRPIKAQLQALGFKVLSKWMDPDVNTDTTCDIDSLGANLELSKAEAERDSAEIKYSDIFIIDTQDVSETGGREVELGMAMRSGCDLFRVGPIRNVFHTQAPAHNSWQELIEYLRENYIHG